MTGKSRKPTFSARLRPAVLGLLLAGLSSERALGQAETLPRGRGLASVFYTRSNTDRRFDFLGDRVRVVPPGGPTQRGFTRTDFVTFDVAYGLTRRLETHVSVPVVATLFGTRGPDGRTLPGQENSPSSTSAGNVRFGLRYNLIDRPFFLTVKADAKAPTSTSDLQQALAGVSLPVNEGQWDLDLAGQASRTFLVGDRELRVGGEAGFRYRFAQRQGAIDTFTNQVLPIKFGNEFVYTFQATYSVWSKVSLTVSGNGIRQRDYDVPFRFIAVGAEGDPKTVGTLGGLPPGFVPDFTKQTGRRIFSLGPLATVTVTPRTFVTGGVYFNVAGRNFPAGRFLVLGVSRVF